MHARKVLTKQRPEKRKMKDRSEMLLYMIIEKARQLAAGIL